MNHFGNNSWSRLCIATAIALALLHCHTSVKDGGGTGKGGQQKRPAQPAKVTVQLVEPRLTPKPLSVVAVLQGQQQVDVYSKVVGRLAKLGPRDGMAVQKGQELFLVDRNDPGESFLSVPVLSPLSGWVGRWHIMDVGEQLNLSDPVITVVDDRVLKATVFLPVADWLSVDEQTQVMVSVADEQRPAKIKAIARAADASSGRGGITIAIENSQRDWRSGLSCRVMFGLKPKERLLLTAAALTVTDTGAYVYTVAEGKAARREVQYAIFDSDTVEILSGLLGYSSVVVGGANLISDGSDVVVVTKETKVQP